MSNVIRRLFLPVGKSSSVSTDDPGYWIGNQGTGLGAFGRMIVDAMNGAPGATGRALTDDDKISIPAVYRGIFLLASLPAFLPLKVFRNRSDGKGSDVDRNHHTFRALYHQPNPWQTSFQWRVAMGMSLHLRGNAYSALIWNERGELDRIHWLHPDRVEVNVDDDGYPIYRVWMNPAKSRPEDSVWLSRHEMHHFWVETLNGYTGCTSIEKCRESIALAHGQREIAARLAANGGRPSGLLTLPSSTNSEARAAAKLSWDEAHKGLGKAGRTAVLPADTKYEPLSMTMEDAQWIESSKFSKEDMCTMLGLMPDFLTISSGQMGGVTGVEQRFLMSLAMRFDPILVAWENALQRDLFDPDELDVVYPKFNRNAMLRTDILTRFRVYALSRQWGLKSADECRALEDENPIGGEAGEHFLSPSNMLRLKGAEASDWDPTPPQQPQQSQGAEGFRPLLVQTLARVYRRAIQDLPAAEKRGDLDGWRRDHEEYASEQLMPIVMAFGDWSPTAEVRTLEPDDARNADPEFLAEEEADRLLAEQ